MSFPDADNPAPLTALSADELRDFVAEKFPDVVGEDKPVAPPQQEPLKKKICVGILSYDARIFCCTMMCLMQAVMQCGEKGWGFTYILREADSMVARGRSFLASQFLTNEGSKDCTDLVMVDTDLSWNGDEFIRLCSHNLDVVGGAYPYKDNSGDFPLRWPSQGLMEENGLWTVQAVTPGFLRITRKALQRMANEMPWLEFKDRGNGEGHRSWMFFDNLQRPNGVYDEGYIFCERWRSMGGVVYLDPDLNLTHTGLRAYNHGTVRQWLDRKSIAFEQLEHEHPEIPPLKLMKKVMGEKVDLGEPNVVMGEQKSLEGGELIITAGSRDALDVMREAAE